MFSANSSQVSDDKLFVEDVFSTYLYDGNSTARNIVNGVDLAGKGGMVWIKTRTQGAAGWDHVLFDTARGANKFLNSNTTVAQNSSITNMLTGFNSDGFSLGVDANTYLVNQTGYGGYASWTFREAPKFFDVVTWTGNGAVRTIAHSLGVAPGCIIIKDTGASGNWWVYHRSRGNDSRLFLNTTDASGGNGSYLNSTDPTATNFTLGANTSVNNNGATYVAYLFAHDATADGIIQCGVYSGTTEVNLGWEPQWLLVKPASNTAGWYMFDNMRGFTSGGTGDNYLEAQSSAAENTTYPFNLIDLTSTGFKDVGFGYNNTIYIAIRRGPMRTPTLGTSVFAPVLASSSDTAGKTFTTNFPVDMQATRLRIGDSTFFTDRLRGVSSTSAETGPSLRSNTTDAESTTSPAPIPRNWNNTGFQLSSSLAGFNMVNWNFRRAPGFFDEVCYTGTGGSDVKPHNLGVAPELMIFKRRNSTGGWLATSNFTATTHRWGYLNTTAAMGESSYSFANILFAAPTATGFTLRTADENNASGGTYVAYLFASAPGVSKVGSYTGNGSSQTINCGFAAGARFVMIKRTDSTGDWYVWDSARGIVAGNDPRLSLNTTAGEVTTDDSVDTDSSGFVVNQVAATNVNVNAATYIYLAIA